MSAHEDLNKAYTAGVTQAGTNWAGSAGADTFRGANQMDTNAPVHLTDAQRKFLLDRVINQATLLGMVRKYAMDRSAVAIPRMSVGTRIARSSTAGGHLESTTMGTRVAPDFENIELKSSRIVLPWTISEEFLQDNPEQGAAEGLIADMMSTQLANDLEDLSVNGDEDSGDPLLHGNDGFTVLGASGNVKDFNGAAFTSNTFEQMMRTMPQKYRNRDKAKLRFFVPGTMEMDWVQTLAARMGDNADAFLSSGGAEHPKYGGVPVVPIAYLPEDGNANGGSNEYTAYLTDPQNLVWGVQKDIQMRKTTEGKNAIDLNERYYALHIRCDFLIQNTEAFVLGKEIIPRVA